MTRPKKEETLAKTKDVHLRMNETEYDLLAERAKAMILGKNREQKQQIEKVKDL